MGLRPRFGADADLAWSATFTGGQDVYYLRIQNAVAAVAGDPTRPIRLHPNLPNPFPAATTITFDAPAGEQVTLAVFDPAGRRVATLLDGRAAGGRHTARWDGTDGAGRAVTSGIYLCRLEVSGFSQTRRLMLLRR